jgi:hypothetical protein
MTKHNGKYYLQYGAPGTEFSGYADGVVVGDHPLGPFTPQSLPFSYKPGGFARGAGHGATFKDNYNNWWHVSTIAISVKNNFERRIGLWPAGFDKDDVMYMDAAFGDYPHYLAAPAPSDSPGGGGKKSNSKNTAVTPDLRKEGSKEVWVSPNSAIATASRVNRRTSATQPVSEKSRVSPNSPSTGGGWAEGASAIATASQVNRRTSATQPVSEKSRVSPNSPSTGGVWAEGASVIETASQVNRRTSATQPVSEKSRVSPNSPSTGGGWGEAGSFFRLDASQLQQTSHRFIYPCQLLRELCRRRAN